MPRQPKYMERNAKTRKFRTENDAPERPESTRFAHTEKALKEGAYIDKNNIIRGKRKNAGGIQEQLEYIAHLARQTGDWSKFNRAKAIADQYQQNIRNTEQHKKDDSQIITQTYATGELSGADAMRNDKMRDIRDARMYDRSTYAGNQSANTAQYNASRGSSSQFTQANKMTEQDVNNSSTSNSTP